MKPIKSICVLLFVAFVHNLHAQLEITDASTAPFTPQNLVNNVFLGSGVDVTNVQFEGDAKAVGFFSGGLGNVNVERGIVLSTAFVEGIDQSNNSSADVGNNDFTSGGNSDAELENIATDGLFDVAKYTITFIPTSDTLRFRYVFASEEYPEFVCNGFNDVFGFFISGPNPDGGTYNNKNIALVPDPSDPSGLTFTNTPVAIDNVQDGSEGNCPASFQEYYNINPTGTQNFKYDAYTSVFTSEAIVVPCESYTIKLAIADVGDRNYGSCVFLEAKSFGTGSLAVDLNSLSVDGSLAEGCGGGELEFSLPEIVGEDYIIDIDFFNPSNAATPGVDYNEIPAQLVIPAGSNSVSWPLEAFVDNESEMDEVISFEIQVDVCNRQQFEIIIRDDNLFAPILPDDVTICASDTFLIDSELDPSFVLPPDPYFENVTEIPISPEMEAIYSDIQVAGVIPTILTPSVIESVCIIGLEHRDLTDFDIFLIAPGGQFLELSTDNGFKADNISDIDRYENTCFTTFATQNINNGENLAGPIFDTNQTYTGDFLPEGVWSDLWDGRNPTNGTWRLLVIDDTNGFEGTLEGWSITFRSFYDLTYEWTSEPVSTHCENCEDIEVSPDQDTEFTLKITDSYGCERSAFMNVSVNPSISDPIASCGNVSQNSVELLWSDVSGNIGYEVRINGGPWISVASTELNYTFSSLASSTDFNVEVRALGPTCNSEIASVLCRTDNCAQPGVIVEIVEQPNCHDSDNGEVILNVSGLAPFSFELNGTTNNTGVFVNVPKGVNEFSVTDSVGCITSNSFLMNGPDEIIMSPGYRLSDPCNVVSNITGSFNITGGSGPYTYQWSNLTTQEEATNLSPGTYVLTVTDDNNCTASNSLIIPELEQFNYTVETSAPSCLDGKDGTATINIISGNGDFSYLWEDGTTNMTNPNLEAGFYAVTVTDGLGCAFPSTFTVDEGAEVVLNISAFDVSCFGQEDGLASVIVEGGVEPYSYFWNGGTSEGDTTKNLPAGDFTLFVSDDNNCMVSESFTIEEPIGMSFNTDKVDNVCFAAMEGELSVLDVSSPNGTVSILWDDNVTTFTREGLAGGEYCFTLNDGTVCELRDCISISSPDAIAVEAEIEGPKCEFSEDGSIKALVEGGTGPYAYTWLGPLDDLAETANIAGLISGLYMLTVVDANLCRIEVEFEVEPPTPIVVDQTVIPIDCKGESTGQILFFASGGSPPFNYSWAGPDGFTATSNNIMDISAGTYTVSYEDAAGCGGSLEFFVQEPSSALSANISAIDTVCFGDADGRLEVSPSGGNSPYRILWSNNVTNEENIGLSSGEYSVTIIDAKDCEVYASSSVIENEDISIELTQTPSSCFQTNDGAAEILSVSYGGIEAAIEDFAIQWNSSPVQSSPLAENLIGGESYSVLLTDRFGCTEEGTILVESPDEVGAEIIEFSNVSCFNEGDGELLITGTGGTGAYSYLWDVNAGASTAAQISDLRKGSYAVTITDENGCIGFNRFAIEEPRPLSMDFRVIDVSCFGGSDGRAEALVQGGVGPYNYSWTNNVSEQAIEGAVSEQYNVTVTDANGCILIDSTKIEEPEEPIMSTVEVEDVSCNNGQNGRVSVSASGGSGFYTYSIDGTEYTSSETFTNLPAGNYTIFVNDFRGCGDTLPEFVILEPAELLVDLGPDIIISFGSETMLNPTIADASGSITYEWQSSNLELLSCTTCLNPTFDGQREASFELLVSDENGCLGSDIVTIRLENYSPMFVPTAFTPNGDGENDVLKVFGAGIDIVETFVIYDRWGELVFETSDVEIGVEELNWNGMFKGEIAPSGLYYWFSEATFDNGFKESFKGKTTLIR